MDKQQAAAEFARGKEDGSTEYGARKEGFIAGWEACEAQSPSDAVNFVHWLIKDGWKILEGVTFYKEPKRGFRIVKGVRDLYNEFNPSGAAPQTDPFIEKHLAKIKELQAHYAEVAAKQAIGPVWVNATAESILFDKIVRNIKTKVVYRHYLYHDLTTAYFEGINDDIYIPLSELEYLDESGAQQIFTRDQICAAFNVGVVAGHKKGIVKGLESQTEYMDTNYPLHTK